MSLRLSLVVAALMVHAGCSSSGDDTSATGGAADGGASSDGGGSGSNGDGGTNPDGSTTSVTTGCADGSGSTYYVGPTGNDATSCADAKTKSTPKQTIQAALACLSAGDNLHVLDGTYADAANALTNLPSGGPNAYITISAETEGNVILQSGLAMAHDDAWIAIRGFRFQDPTGRSVLGNHVKLCGNEMKGGCASGNCANTTVGTNDTNDTADILLEDNWWHGEGGRYDLVVYNSNRVVVRRGVIRHDGGWTDDKGDPEAGINFYNSSSCSAQNVIVLDNDLTYSTWQGAFYAVYNSASPNATTDNSWLGDIALKSPVGGGFRLDGDGLVQATVDNMVLWDAEYAAALGSGSSQIQLSMNHVTAGRTTTGGGSGFVQFASSYTGTISNAIVVNVDTPTDGTSLTGFDAFGNGGAPSGSGGVSYTPFTNGLLYLPRTEAGSMLQTAGFGARITTRMGTSGALHGDPGWNTDTGESLWPYPNEARIKKEMCDDAGVTRGFCGDTSLTHYVMNVLGNGSPY